MVAPTFKKANDTAEGDATKYGAPDIRYAFDVLDGTHSTDRIQMSNIEGRDKYATYAFYVRQKADNTFEAINSATGLATYSGAEFAPVMNSAIGALPAPSATNPIGTIYISGSTLDCVTVPVTISLPVIIDGLGSAVVRRNGTYTSPNRAVFRIQSSDVTIKNLTVVDQNQDGGANRLITCQPSSTDYSNILIDNVRIKNAHNAIYFHGVSAGDLIEHAVIRNCWIDNVANLGTTLTGPGIVLGMGCKNILVDNCYMIEPGDTGIDVFATEEFIKLHGNYIFKNVRTTGGGINVSNYGTTTAITGPPTNSISIRDNRVYGPILGDGITITGAAEKVFVVNNFVKLGTRDGIVVTPKTISATDYHAKEVQILANIVQDVGRTGILVNTVSTIAFQAFNVSNNYVTETDGNAITLDGANHAVVTNNMIYRYGIDAAADRSGIRLRNTTFSTIQANSIFGLNAGSNPAAGQNYAGIAEVNTCNNNIIRGNTMNSQPIIMVGANTIVSHNNGFRTENSGTVTTSTPSATVTHGLGYTPALKEIFVTPTTAWGNMTSFYASAPTSTQFTINCPGNNSSVTLAWQVARSY